MDNSFKNYRIGMNEIRFELIGFLLMTTVSLYGQNNPHTKNESTNTRIGVRTILWIPAGKLARTFQSSPGFEFEIGRGVDASFQDVNLYCSFIKLNGNSFNYCTADTLVSTKSKLLLMTGLKWRDEEIIQSGFFDFTTIYLGIGAATFFIDYKNAEGNRKAFGNFHLYIGKTYSKRVFNNQFAGITLQYNLIPKRGLPRNVDQTFGNSSFTLGLEYRF